MRSKAFSTLANSRLSTSASCELISSWAESSAASTRVAGGLSAEFFEQAQVPGQGLAERIAPLD